jgi:hypothetical protein
VLALLLALCTVTPAVEFAGGSGEPNDPYQIATAEQMNGIGAEPNYWDKHFKLVSDIDLSDYDGQDGRPAFNLIGCLLGPNNRKPFTGVFDGNGHTISNFHYASTGRDAVGLFGYVRGFYAEIRNLGLIGPTVDGGAGSYVGSLVGQMEYGSIAGCYVENTNVVGGHEVGGLAGRGCAVSNSYSTGSVRGQAKVGGLVGGNTWKVADCYSTAHVSGNDSIGGLVGCPAGGRGDNLGLILNSYSTGRVTGTTAVGGLIGATCSNVIGSYWDIETTGQAESAGGIGKTTLEMQTARTFLGWGACEHNGVWTVDEGRDYPRFSWEGRPGQPLGPLELADLLAGSGTLGNPFLIYTAEELNMIGLFPCEWNRCFRLMADIDMSSHEHTAFNVIGVYEIPFKGMFDGNDRNISHLVVDASRGIDAGLFAYVQDPNAEIRDLRLTDCSVKGGKYGSAGALVASLFQGSVVDCHGVNNTVSGQSRIGGLVGSSISGTIRDCSSTGTVAGTYDTGGLVGENYASVTRCSAAAIVTGEGSVGGLAGSNDGTICECHSASAVDGGVSGGLVGRNTVSPAGGTIVNSYATGTVSGSWRGGLVGDNAAGAITNCYSAAVVTGSAVGGGLVANDWQEAAHITGSFWDTVTSGHSASAGGMGKTTAEMQTAATFIDAGWDFADTWMICEGTDYPRLRWEQVACDE